MALNNIKSRLHKYIVRETMAKSNEIKEDTLLFEQGIFDSIGLLLLIEYIKEEFNVNTDDDELLLENFESISSMATFIGKKIQFSN